MRAAALVLPLFLVLSACDSDDSNTDQPDEETFPGDASLLGMWEEREDSGPPDYIHFQPNEAATALRVRIWEDRDGGCYELDEDYSATYAQVTAAQLPGPGGDGPIGYALSGRTLTLTGLSGGGGSERYGPSNLTPADIGPLCP